MNRTGYFISRFKGKVLNIGCYGSESYNRMHSTGYPELYGLDLVKGDKEKRIAKGNALTTKYSQEFDLIIAGELIEHLYPKQAEKFLSNCRKALKEGGELIITTPNKNALTNRLFHRFDKAKPSEYQGHVNIFTIERLKQTAQKAGFQVQEYFCLPYARESSPNQHFLVYAVRKAIHYILPQSLQEEIVILLKKA